MTTPPLAPILAHLRAAPQRTGSIVVTIFGDAVMPRGGTLWLGTLIEILAGMEIGPGVVRTASARLVAEGWLARSRLGRNSFFRLTAPGDARFIAAAAKIYGAPGGAGEALLHFLLAERATPRASLIAAGFAPLTGDLWVSPRPPDGATGLGFAAHLEGGVARALAARAWPLAELADAYNGFVAAFAPLDAALAAGDVPSGRAAMVARSLLIHEYRRVRLRDPALPLALLPEDWPGRSAFTLCARLYRALLAPSERWLDAHARSDTGKLPPPDATLAARFGGS